MPKKPLVKKILFEGTIEAVTGLHIGGSDVGLAIGGADKVVVRNPKDGRPYIPGSSLKGKLRTLLERVECAQKGCLFEGQQRDKVEACRCRACDVCRLFGVAIEKEAKGDAGAARLLVRDASLSNAEMVAKFSGLSTPYAEVKTEVSIDRVTSQANPRQFERVPAGAQFAFSLVLDLHEGDDEARYTGLIQQALRLLADDGLGGQISRGYGRVKVTLERRLDIRAAAYASAESFQAAHAKNLLASAVVYPPESA